MEDINALDLLKEEMETEEIHLKVNVIHRLKTIILALGVDDTLKKLYPYLECNYLILLMILLIELIEKEDDEVLFAIAEELGKVWYSSIYNLINSDIGS
jgi:serine/threonine-protein phosphatase 2A regulatory subunit A